MVATFPIKKVCIKPGMVHSVLQLDHQIADLDQEVASFFKAHHPDAPIITSLTGIGNILGAEFLAATGGTLAGFTSADHLAGYAGLAPTPHDSGQRTGNLHRPQRYNRQLQRVFYTSAMISIQTKPRLAGLLRPQTNPRQTAHPSRASPRTPPRQRHVGHAPRPPALPRTTTGATTSRLTSGLRISCRRQCPGPAPEPSYRRFQVIAHKGACRKVLVRRRMRPVSIRLRFTFTATLL
jgi:hypothetical protein